MTTIGRFPTSPAGHIHSRTYPPPTIPWHLRIIYLRLSQSAPKNAPKSPLAPSSTSLSKRLPYRLRYSSLILSRCARSQWKRTRRETRSSVRSREVSVARDWCRRRASRTGRLRAPFRMWARVSPCGRGGGGLVGVGG